MSIPTTAQGGPVRTVPTGIASTATWPYPEVTPRANRAPGQRLAPAHPDDKALIDAYLMNSSTPKTAKVYANHLFHLAGWLRATPDDEGHARPTLEELRDTLNASGACARDDPHVQAFRQSQAGSLSAREKIASAVDALVWGNKAQATLHPDDKALIDAYRQFSRTNALTAQIHASHLAHLAGWLRATPDDQGRARPTLRELHATQSTFGGRARYNAHVQAFQQSQAGTPSARINIAGAVDALVRRNTAQPTLHPDDKALIDAFRQFSSTNALTAQIHASYLAHLAGWLRATPDDRGRARPTLRELHATQSTFGGRARYNSHVQAFRHSQAGTPSARRYIAGAVDALVRGNPDVTSAGMPLRSGRFESMRAQSLLGLTETMHSAQQERMVLKFLGSNGQPTELPITRGPMASELDIEQRGVVKEVWEELGKGYALLNGGEVQADGSRVVRFELSTSDYIDSLIGREGTVQLPLVRGKETPHQYWVSMHERAGHVLGLMVESEGEGDLQVSYRVPTAD